MGIVTAQTLYRTDGGRVMPVTEMSDTHLMNAIMHHKKQCDLVIIMIQRRSANALDIGTLEKWRDNLKETIDTLENEFVTRDPDADRTLMIQSDGELFQQFDRSY